MAGKCASQTHQKVFCLIQLKEWNTYVSYINEMQTDMVFI